MEGIIKALGWLAAVYICASVILTIGFSLWHHEPKLVIPFVTTFSGSWGGYNPNDRLPANWEVIRH